MKCWQFLLFRQTLDPYCPLLSQILHKWGLSASLACAYAESVQARHTTTAHLAISNSKLNASSCCVSSTLTSSAGLHHLCWGPGAAISGARLWVDLVSWPSSPVLLLAMIFAYGIRAAACSAQWGAFRLGPGGPLSPLHQAHGARISGKRCRTLHSHLLGPDEHLLCCALGQDVGKGKADGVCAQCCRFRSEPCSLCPLKSYSGRTRPQGCLYITASLQQWQQTHQNPIVQNNPQRLNKYIKTH